MLFIEDIERLLIAFYVDQLRAGEVSNFVDNAVCGGVLAGIEV